MMDLGYCWACDRHPQMLVPIRSDITEGTRPSKAQGIPYLLYIFSRIRTTVKMRMTTTTMAATMAPEPRVGGGGDGHCAHWNAEKHSDWEGTPMVAPYILTRSTGRENAMTWDIHFQPQDRDTSRLAGHLSHKGACGRPCPEHTTCQNSVLGPVLISPYSASNFFCEAGKQNTVLF